MQSYPTPPQAANIEWMNESFLKLHPGAVIHYFKECRDDEYHTHPFSFTTHIIEGGYREEVLVKGLSGKWEIVILERHPGTSHTMPVNMPHKLTGLLNGPCITRCEYGLTVQKPGFCRFAENGTLLHRFWDQNEWHPYNALAT